MERQTEVCVISDIRTWRLRWRFLHFIIFPVDKLHTALTCGTLSLLVWSLNGCVGKFMEMCCVSTWVKNTRWHAHYLSFTSHYCVSVSWHQSKTNLAPEPVTSFSASCSCMPHTCSMSMHACGLQLSRCVHLGACLFEAALYQVNINISKMLQHIFIINLISVNLNSLMWMTSCSCMYINREIERKRAWAALYDVSYMRSLILRYFPLL